MLIDLTGYPDVRVGYPPAKFDAVWNAIKGWDIQRTPGQGYAGATGTDVATILDALEGL